MLKSENKDFEIGFRLSENSDPEERLEEAILWKMMHDHYGDRISLIEGASELDIPTFGRSLSYSGGKFHNRATNPVSDHLPYWDDKAFRESVSRSFEVVDYDQLGNAVSKLHEGGKHAFIKSTRPKHHKQTIRCGENVYRALDAMAYSFMDGGPRLMVQEWTDMIFEYRFFIINREIVTWSTKMDLLTPLDFPHIKTTGYRRQDDPGDAADCGRLIGRYLEFLKPIVEKTDFPDVSIDLALRAETRDVEIVEYNPMQLGQLGLFACDAKSLVQKSEVLLQRWTPKPETNYLITP